jgi:hypothetical protein
VIGLFVQRASEISLRFAEKFFEDGAVRQPYMNSFMKSTAYSQQVGTKKVSVSLMDINLAKWLCNTSQFWFVEMC